MERRGDWWWLGCPVHFQLLQYSWPGYLVKYKVRKMATRLVKQHCYCPMLLMQTTKTAVCLQTKAIFHHLYGLVF